MMEDHDARWKVTKVEGDQGGRSMMEGDHSGRCMS